MNKLFTCRMKNAVTETLFLVSYQLTPTGQSLHNYLPSKKALTKRTICYYSNPKLSVGIDARKD